MGGMGAVETKNTEADFDRATTMGIFLKAMLEWSDTRNDTNLDAAIAVYRLLDEEAQGYAKSIFVMEFTNKGLFQGAGRHLSGHPWLEDAEREQRMEIHKLVKVLANAALTQKGQSKSWEDNDWVIKEALSICKFKSKAGHTDSDWQTLSYKIGLKAIELERWGLALNIYSMLMNEQVTGIAGQLAETLNITLINSIRENPKKDLSTKMEIFFEMIDDLTSRNIWFEKIDAMAIDHLSKFISDSGLDESDETKIWISKAHTRRNKIQLSIKEPSSMLETYKSLRPNLT